VSAAVAPVAHLAGRLAQVTGLARLIGPWAYRRVLSSVSRRGPVVPSSVVRSVYGRGEVIGTVLAEYSAYREMAADLAALRTRRRLPAIPLTVLTALGDVRGQERTRWASCHARLATMSPYGRQVRLSDCRHMIQLDRPEAIADAVTEITRRRTRGVS
jgi:pimeloyl-ACP methyl ester carboxylesterase